MPTDPLAVEDGRTGRRVKGKQPSWADLEARVENLQHQLAAATAAKQAAEHARDVALRLAVNPWRSPRARE